MPTKKQQRATAAAGTTVLKRSTLSLMVADSISSMVPRVGGMFVLVILQVPSIRGVDVGMNAGFIAAMNL